MASTADSLIWGRGPYACPGRYMVQDVLKLMFVHILMHYDFKYPEEGDKLFPSADVTTSICSSRRSERGRITTRYRHGTSPVMGLAADRVLQIIIATTDGHMRIMDRFQVADLFWAL